MKSNPNISHGHYSPQNAATTLLENKKEYDEIKKEAKLKKLTEALELYSPQEKKESVKKNVSILSTQPLSRQCRKIAAVAFVCLGITYVFFNYMMTSKSES